MASTKSNAQSKAKEPPRRVPGQAKPPEPIPEPASIDAVLPRSLMELVDLVVRVTLSGSEETILGRLYAVDPLTGFMALECGPPDASTSKASVKRDYQLVRLSQIKQVVPLEQTEGTLPAVGSTVQLRALSTTAVQNVEKAALKAEEQKLARRGPPGVSKLGQGLFDGLCKTLPCRWQDTTIVVLDDIFIAPPYHACLPAPGTKPDRQKIDRVSMVLDGTRRQVMRARAAAAQNATN